ncbi:MAG: FHA domain-containing protein [Proteobacteria bacterium]|nr:FHA domain-containing protein [Pseudomonadota bacterium]MBU1688052.1 FHA domain-containing protein [Pseudomonadota bacterium]
MDQWALILNNRIIKKFTITEGQTLIIGRGKEADVRVDNNAISREHTSIELKGGVYYLTDLYSLNGTLVNGEKIESVPVQKTDQIMISKFVLKAVELIEDADIAESHSSAMDVDESTIFVGGKSQEIHHQTADSTSSDHQLVLQSGSCNPNKLSLKGKESIKAGTDPSSDLTLSGWFLGHTQFFISRKKEGFFINHHSGFRKTQVNGQTVQGERLLQKGDILQAGSVKIKFD